MNADVIANLLDIEFHVASSRDLWQQLDDFISLLAIGRSHAANQRVFPVASSTDVQEQICYAQVQAFIQHVNQQSGSLLGGFLLRSFLDRRTLVDSLFYDRTNRRVKFFQVSHAKCINRKIQLA